MPIQTDNTLRILSEISGGTNPGIGLLGEQYRPEIKAMIEADWIRTDNPDSPFHSSTTLQLTKLGEHYLDTMTREEKYLPVGRVLKAILYTLPFIFSSWWLSSLGLDSFARIPETAITVITFGFGYSYIKREESTHFNSSRPWFPSFVAIGTFAVVVAVYFGVFALLDCTIDEITQTRYDSGHETGYDIGYYLGYQTGLSDAYEEVAKDEYELGYWVGWEDGVEDAWAEIEAEYGIDIGTD